MENDLLKDCKQAQHEITREWLTALYQCLMVEENCSPKVAELTYWKSTVMIDGGGEYLLTLQHVNGPKLPLRTSNDDDCA